jgi:two-component system LytT family response regulator
MAAQSEAIRVLVVDDEPPARKRLTDLLKSDRDVREIHEAPNGAVAVSQIQDQRPDVVFLDVQMPGIDGFGVIGALGAENMPLTVFVTGYDRFAVKAFEADALDYLLKPFPDSRYEQMMARVKARLGEIRKDRAKDPNSFSPELLQLAARRFKPGEIWEWIAVKTKDSTHLVMTEEIDWIEASGVYVTLHAGTNVYLHRASLAAVGDHLDPFRFVRIHRSTIVNIRSVTSLERRSHGEFELVLKTGARLMLSRSYRGLVESVLGQSL